jgi:CheY-like chemotaxis protein/LmbE family N-acetylglucosaminyl deacetylase
MDDSGPAPVRGRILVIDDDLVFGRWAAQLLQTEGRFETRYVTDAVTGLEHLDDGPWDLVLTDLEMPGMNGLELLDRIAQLEPDLPVAIITGHATVDRAVTAFRKSAAEFIQKPISATDFMIAVQGLVQRGRETRAAHREIVLAVGAHPGDVEIGAAGTLLAHKSAGDSVAILALTGGGQPGAQVRRPRGPQHAAGVIGARLFLGELDDADIAEGEPTIGVIEDVIARIRPTVLYMHSVHDVHQAHRNTHQAVIVAARQVGRVYCFQSATPTVDFRPTHFSVIDSHASRKLAAIDAFADEPQHDDYLQPDLVVSTARYWSRFCGGSLAEPFEAVRDRAPVRVPAGAGAAAGAPAGAPAEAGTVIRRVRDGRTAPAEPGRGPGPHTGPGRIAHLPGARLTHRTVTSPAGRRCDSGAHSDIPLLFPVRLRQRCLHRRADPGPGPPGTRCPAVLPGCTSGRIRLRGRGRPVA